MPEESTASVIMGGNEETTQTQDTTQTTPTTSTGPNWDDFASKISGGIVEGLKPAVAARTEPERKMTPEEARKALNVWEPDDNWYAQYDNLEQRKQAIAAMRDGMFKQNATYVQALVEHRLKEIREELTGKYDPIAERFSTYEVERQTERLHKEHPGLADPALAPLVQAVGTHLITNKMVDGKSEKEAFKMLADGVEAVMRKSNPNFSLSGGTPATGVTKTKPNGSNANAIPTTTGGGGGGGGNGGGGASTGNRALDILKGIATK